MTSFELYTKYRKAAKNGQCFDVTEQAYNILRGLWNESLDGKLAFSDIKFVSVVKSMIETEKLHKFIDETKICVFDAYIIINALYTCIQKRRFSDNCIDADKINALFKEWADDISKEKRIWLTKTDYRIKDIEAIINDDHKKRMITQTKEDQSRPDIARGKSPVPASVMEEHSHGKVLNRQAESGPINRENYLSNDRMKNNQHVGPEKIAEPADLKINERRRENKEIIDKWHSEIDDISSTLKSVQPDVKTILERIMGFSNQITDKYVLQFARNQIELYNLISDNYMYHKRKSEQSGTQDYINAVSNYEEFLYSLLDSLAVFGVEEIVSCPGDRFDGSIHESKRNDFSSHNSVIKKSIRSGFRYRNIIIQKEKVEI